MWDSFTLGIRCPTDGSTCAALAKEPVTDEDQVRKLGFVVVDCGGVDFVVSGGGDNLKIIKMIKIIKTQMDMVATYNETTSASNDPRKDLPAGFYTMRSLVRFKFKTNHEI